MSRRINPYETVFNIEAPKDWRLVLSKRNYDIRNSVYMNTPLGKVKCHPSLGRTFSKPKIIWVANINNKEERLHVLLHEITHAVVTKRHDNIFYEYLIELDKKYQISPKTVWRVEDYVPNALAKWMGVPE